ncbi:MAG: hypothetical protein HY908_12005 [Myxococcales bacterium]|nr:hypothetical protein [Myxococcales bacterium]
MKSFNAGGRLGRVTKEISGYLTVVRPFVVKLDAALKPYFDDKLASEELDKAKNELDAADTKQEVGLANLPEATLQVYEAKGRVLHLIEELNRLAKNAFDGQAEIVGKFNKDILLRGRAPRGPAQPKVADPPG